MTLPLFVADPADLAGATPGSSVALRGPEARHAVRSLRLRPGERYLLTDGAGARATLVVTAADAEQLLGRVEDVTHEPAPACRLVLVQALAKGGRDEQAVESAVELGVDAIVPWQADRSIVQWRADKASKGVAKWQSVVLAATKQSRRAWRPEVLAPVDEGGLSSLVAGASTAYVLHEDATDPLATQRLPASGDVLVIVGPEGGVSQRELDVLARAGAMAVRLGEPVLRSSTAGPAALAVLSAQGRWR